MKLICADHCPNSAHPAKWSIKPGHTALDVARMSRADLTAELVANVSFIADGGIEAAVARKLALAREIICRDLFEEMKQMKGRTVMESPGKVGEWLKLYCVGLEYEVFLVMYLDAPHRLIHAEQLFRGTLSQTSVHPREVLKQALSCNASAVIFAHNHPGGVAECSHADEQLTRILRDALALVDVRVLDHFIVAGDTLVSLAERGLL
jgi:DNA repair protein RadC